MRAPKYRPLDKIEFARALGFKSEHRTGVKEALRGLERSGEIARIRKNRYILPRRRRTSSPENCKSIRLALLFSPAKIPTRATFSSPRKIPARR